MPGRRVNSRALRELADDLLGRIADQEELDAGSREELITSLVRQWIGYEGTATLFVDEQQVYFVLKKTRLGKITVNPEPALPCWIPQLTQDWKVNREVLPSALEQLNRGQSAEVTNDEGIPLRLWVNPKERSRGVEELVKRPALKKRRDYRKIAITELEQQFGESLDPKEMQALAGSLVKQWQRHEGHACLFIDGSQLSFTLTELPGGKCKVESIERNSELDSLLVSLGFSPEMLPEVIAKINLDRVVGFQDKNGVPSALWHDPRARRIIVQALRPGSA
jgi:hypothetical protein